MNSLSTLRLTSKDVRVFVTTETGYVCPIPNTLDVQWQNVTEYVEVTTMSSYYPEQVPIRRHTNIEIVSRSDRDVLHTIPHTGIINVAEGEYSYAVKYYLQETAIEAYGGYPSDLIRYNLVGLGSLLEGEHRAKLYVVRFDLGDGTYKELYTHEREADLAVERYYNRQNLWS